MTAKSLSQTHGAKRIRTADLLGAIQNPRCRRSSPEFAAARSGSDSAGTDRRSGPLTSTSRFLAAWTLSGRLEVAR